MKRTLNVILSTLAVVLIATSCCYSSMMKKAAPGISASVSPEYVTLKGDNAVGTITVNFPAKTFDKWGVMKVTPVIKYAGGEAVGEPKFLQGEKVQDNYTVISHKTGGSYQQSIAMPYKKDMRLAQLVLRVEAKCIKGGNKIKNFTPYTVDIPVGMGVSSLQMMADDYAKVAIAPDAFVRTTYQTQEARIMFEKNKSNVRTAQLNSSEVAALQQFIKDNTGDAKKKVGDVVTKAYASPEGPLAFNNKLSGNRGTSTQKAVETKFKKDGTPKDKFEIESLGEDWEGFKELVSKSNIQDKELILQVLSMYNDPQVRDKEIRNMSSAFKVLQEKILPELRRSRMAVQVEIQGKTDDELKAAASSSAIGTLTVEEMLFSATLFEDVTMKFNIYKSAADKYNDFRAWNNMGVTKAKQGNYAEAKANFLKAAAMNNSNPQVLNNLGVVALAEGNKAEAAKYFAASTAPEAKYNKGLVELANGNYAAAASVLDGYNKALAELLNNNTAAAKSALASMQNWQADYLKAVIAAREGNVRELVDNLKNAVRKSPAAKTLAETEVNFVKYAANSDFASVVTMKKF